MTVHCPGCGRTLIAQAPARAKQLPASCSSCEIRFEVSTWPAIGPMPAQATLEAVENLVPW